MAPSSAATSSSSSGSSISLADITRIVIVRHGEAQTFVDQVIGGAKGCTGLSERGRRQAAALRDRLAGTGELVGAAALYTSVLPRAIETAEIISPALGGLIIERDCDLCEVHVSSEIDGLPWEEFDARSRTAGMPSVYEPWGPGFETWADFVARVGRALYGLAARHHGETVVIAAHGGIVDASFTVLGTVPLVRGFQLHTENTSITEWERTDGESQWRLVRYNDAGHLFDS